MGAETTTSAAASKPMTQDTKQANQNAGQPSAASAGSAPPPAKKGWDHSEMVLVYYAADPEMDHTSAWSIAYFHHNPPFKEKPCWVDFTRSWGTPDYWWPLPQLPNDRTERPEATK